ncbi:MAG: hypothetical protein FJX57_14720, partial [Alphaproteobacteria bacterium]|nr:hypothetical protein [Alphaproteobacteria bacterium]
VGGAHETDAYLAEWRRQSAGSCGDDLETAASVAVARLEHDYDDARLAMLARGGGRASA